MNSTLIHVPATPLAYLDAPPEDDNGLRESVVAAGRQWRWVVSVFLVIAVAGGWFVMNTPDQYRSGAVMSFVPREGNDISGSLAALLVTRYPEVVAAEDSVAAAAEASGATGSEVSGGLAASIAPETLNLVFSTTLASPEAAFAATESLHRSVLAANESDVDLRAVTVSAPSGWGSVGPPSTLMYAAVLFVALVAAFVVGLVADGLSPRRA